MAQLDVTVVENGIRQTSSKLDGLASSAMKAASAVGLVVSAGSLMSKLVQQARAFDKLNAGLVTMTGSAANAALAFGVLEEFAASTPYSLEQSVQGFTKLVSLGLTPSQAALESFGNTAAAMGKDLNQMVEAVADATTGEFERLKEFGIKASAQGDQVAFTFQGVTTSVKNNAAEIEKYLTGIGQNQFAGAMANRMATLDGALSNLEDSWDKLFRSISSAGVGTEIQSSVGYAISALDELSAMISSGELQQLVSAFGSGFTDVFKDIEDGIESADKFLTSTLNQWGIDAASSSNFMSDAFWQFPANIKAAIQVATVEIAGFVDKSKVYADIYARMWDPRNLFAENGILGDSGDQLKAIDQNVKYTASGILDVRQQTINKMEEEKRKAAELRAEYERQREENKKIDLGQFKIQPGETGDDPKAAKAAAKAAEAAAKKAESEKKRNAEELERNKKAAADYITQLQQRNMSELALIDVHEQEKIVRLADYRNQGAIAEDQFAAARKEAALTARNERMKYYEDEARQEAEIAYERNEQIKKAQEEKTEQIAMQLDALNSLYTTFGGNANNTYKTLFLASKLFAQKDAIVMQANAMMKAWASAPFPYNLGAVATTALETAPLLATIATTSFSGRMQGGQVAAGDVRMVGERGPELVQFGRNGTVIPNSALGGATTTQQVVNVHNYAGTAVSTQQNSDGSTDIFIRKDELADLLASQAGNPNSKMNRAQGGVYERRRA